MMCKVEVCKTNYLDSRYSAEYRAIREKAEKEWPVWMKQYYNDNVAVSAHARKFEID